MSTPRNTRSYTIAAALALVISLCSTDTRAEAYHIDDYGAQPNNPAHNSAPALMAAVSAAINAGAGHEVVLGTGRYYMAATDDGLPFALITGAEDLTIRGQGRDQTWIVNTRPKGAGFQFMQGRDITLSDFAYDHDPLPFTQGVVTARSRSQNYVDVQIDSGFPLPTDAWYTDANLMGSIDTRWAMAFDPTTRRMKIDAPDFMFLSASVENRGGGVYRFHMANGLEQDKISTIDVGDLFVAIIRPVIGGPLFFYQTINSTAERIDIHASPSLALTSLNATRTTIRDCAVRPLTAENRLISTNGDGWHFQQDRVGPLIEDTYLAGMADDGIAINCFPNIIGERVNDTQLIVDSVTLLEAGDEVIIFNPRDGEVLLRANIQSLSTTSPTPGMNTAFAYLITLDQTIPSLTLVAETRDSDHLYSISASGQDYIVRNNTVEHHRGRSVFVQSAHGLIEGNTLSRSSSFAIVVANEPSWPLGPIPGHTIIRNNTVTNAVENEFWFAGSALSAAIQVRGSRGDNDVAYNRLVEDIEITGNTVVNPPATGIYVAAVSNVRMYGNTVLSDGSRVAPKSDEAIILDQVGEAVLVNNQIVDTPGSPLFRDGLRLTSTVDNGCEGLALADLQTSLAPGRLAIRDERTVPGNYVCGSEYFRFPVILSGLSVAERGIVGNLNEIIVQVSFPTPIVVTNLPQQAFELDGLELVNISGTAEGYDLHLRPTTTGSAAIRVADEAFTDTQGWLNAGSRTFRFTVVEVSPTSASGEWLRW